MDVQQTRHAIRFTGLKDYKGMKIVWDVIGFALIVAGIVWFVQGVGLLPGSFMSGQAQWAVYGGLAILVGAGLLLYVNRREAR
jgi:hypothetical protein